MPNLNNTTKFATKTYPFSNTNRYVVNPKEKNIIAKNMRMKQNIPRKLMAHKENQMNGISELVSINSMEAQSNMLTRFMPSNKNLTNRFQNFTKYEGKKYITTSSKFKLSTNQRFTGAIRKIVISNKPCLKRRNNREMRMIDKSRARKDFFDYNPQPSAFVHILSAFISSSFESNFTCDHESLVSLRALSRMLGDVSEKNSLSHEGIIAARRELSLSLKESNKSIATFISPNEFSIDKSSSTTAQEINIDEDKIQHSSNSEENDEVDKVVSNCSNSMNDSSKDSNAYEKEIVVRPNINNALGEDSSEIKIDELEAHNDSIFEENIIVTDPEVVSTQEKPQPECEILFQKNLDVVSVKNIQTSYCEMNQEEKSIEVNEKIEENIDHNVENKISCPKIVSIFRLNCINDYSRQKFSLSCPCIKNIEYSYQYGNFHRWIQVGSENEDEIEEINSNSEDFKNKDSKAVATNEVCDSMNEDGNMNGKCECGQIHQNPQMQNSEDQNKNSQSEEKNVFNDVKTEPEKNITENRKFSCKCILTRCCSEILCDSNQKKNCNEKKSIITLFLNERKVLPQSVRKKNCIEFEFGRKKNSDIDMKNFKNEVLEFFGICADRKKDIEKYTTNSFEDLTLPGVNLVIPKFSEVLPDIEKTIRERINQFLANPNFKTEYRSRAHCDDKNLTFLFMK